MTEGTGDHPTDAAKNNKLKEMYQKLGWPIKLVEQEEKPQGQDEEEEDGDEPFADENYKGFLKIKEKNLLPNWREFRVN